MSDERRCDRQHGLFLVARELCATGMTDGFCSPATRESCHCWNRAVQAMASTGFSGQALAWIFSHRTKIEAEAAKCGNAQSSSKP